MSVFGAGSGLYRERALKRGDMRESLDERVRVVSVPRWIALAIGILLLFGFVAWSTSSEIDTSVEASGAVGSSPAAFAVEAPAAGEVLPGLAAAGAKVEPGDVVARIATPEGRRVPVRVYDRGQLAAVDVRPGSVVEPGDPIATFEPGDAETAVYLFVPAGEVSEVERGQQVVFDRGGGRVRRVADRPASPERLVQVLGPALGRRVADGPLVVEVEVAPDGSAGRRELGAPAEGRIVVSRRSPLDFVF